MLTSLADLQHNHLVSNKHGLLTIAQTKHMSNLIATTLDALTIPGMTPGDAARQLIDGLNADLRTAYSTNDLGKWRRADRATPQPVQDWMLRACVAYAIRQCGGMPPPDDERIDQLAVMLCPPHRSTQ